VRFLAGSPLLLEEFGNVDLLIYTRSSFPPPKDCMVVRENDGRIELYKNGDLVGSRESKNNPVESFIFEPIKGLKIFLSSQLDLENLEIFRLAFYMNTSIVTIFLNEEMDEDDILSILWPIVQDNYFLMFVATPSRGNVLYSLLAPTGFTNDRTGILGLLEPFLYCELKISVLHRLKRSDPLFRKMKSKAYIKFLLKHFG